MNWLNKEYVLKKKNSGLLIEALGNAALIMCVFYFLVLECGSDIIDVFNTLLDYNLLIKFSIIMFPFVFIIIAIFKVFSYSLNNKSVVKKRKK